MAFSEGGPPAVVIAVDDPEYIEACGACHFPYPPGLLPARSWEALIASLEDHFGENAELLPDEVNIVRNFLLTNAAADKSESELSKEIWKYIPFSQIPLRITQTPLFESRHQEVIAILGANRKLSDCIVCHPNADDGDFSEDDARVPGMGRWENWHF